jgi:HPt (histidine-containing phosphotransfer) domain-containing protein
LKIFIDYNSLLDRTAGDVELIKEIVSWFDSQLPIIEKELIEISSKNDLNEIAFFCHRIKSSVGTLSFDALYDKLNFLEQEAKKNNTLIDYNLEILFIFTSLKEHLTELKKHFKL